MATSRTHDAYAPFRILNFRYFWFWRVMGASGRHVMYVAIGWQLYEMTHDAMALAYVGLAQVIPSIFLSLPAGHLVDRFDRRRILLIGEVIFLICSFLLAWGTYTHISKEFIYGILFILGTTRAFYAPAASSLLLDIVSGPMLSNAMAWANSGFYVASMAGPAIGGWLIAWNNTTFPAYIGCIVISLVGCSMMISLSLKRSSRAREPISLLSLTAGISFIWRAKVILASMTLDLFAVLLGGAISLLPIFAKDILHVGPSGLGWMRAAPSLGAFCMALLIAHTPPIRKAGHVLVFAVIGFGIVTIGFGLSKTFWFSLLMLFLTGAFDDLSVVIRHTLIQGMSPDHMRGRVSSVNSLFINISNDLGGFESGLVAAWFTPVISVVFGGIGTLIAVVASVIIWPQLLKLGALDRIKPMTEVAIEEEEEIKV